MNKQTVDSFLPPIDEVSLMPNLTMFDIWAISLQLHQVLQQSSSNNLWFFFDVLKKLEIYKLIINTQEFFPAGERFGQSIEKNKIIESYFLLKYIIFKADVFYLPIDTIKESLLSELKDSIWLLIQRFENFIQALIKEECDNMLSIDTSNLSQSEAFGQIYSIFQNSILKEYLFSKIHIHSKYYKLKELKKFFKYQNFSSFAKWFLFVFEELFSWEKNNGFLDQFLIDFIQKLDTKLWMGLPKDIWEITK